MKFCIVPCCLKPRSSPKKRNSVSGQSKRMKRVSPDLTSEVTNEVVSTSSEVSSKHYFLTTLNLSSTLSFINLSAKFSSHNIVVISEKLETCEYLSMTMQPQNKDTKPDRIFRDIQRTYCFCIEKELDYFLTKNQTDTVVVMYNCNFESNESLCCTIENLQWEFVRGIVFMVNNLNEYSTAFREVKLDYKIIK